MILAREPNARDGYRLLTSAARLVQRLHDDALAPLGLTRAAVIALEAVAPRPMYQEQLAARVHVQSQTLGRVLARLEDAGLVTQDAKPGRSAPISGRDYRRRHSRTASGLQG